LINVLLLLLIFILYHINNNKDKRELEAPVCLKTDYEDNKMKKDTLATLHGYTNNHLLSNLHKDISILLNNAKI